MSKIYFAADHAGFALKNALTPLARSLGYDVEDLGAFSENQEDDYPDFVTPLAHRVASEPDARGVVIGGSGQGEAMCANRISGVRAAVFYGPMRALLVLESEGSGSQDGFDAVRLPRLHNNANILSLGARFVSESDAEQALRIFLETSCSDNPRHTRRLAKF